jgi:hypothetical protein
VLLDNKQLVKLLLKYRADATIRDTVSFHRTLKLADRDLMKLTVYMAGFQNIHD